MTATTKDITIVVLILLIGGILFFWGKSCNQINPALSDVSKQIHIADSVKAVNTVLSVKLDSSGKKYTKDSLKFQHKIDSLSKRVITLADAFNQTKSKLVETNAKLDSAIARSDTTVAYSICKELSDELTEANNQLFALQITQDSVSTAKDSEIVRLNTVITGMRGAIASLQQEITALLNTQQATATDAAKIARQKKFSSIMAKAGWLTSAVLGFVLLIKK